MSTRVLLMTAVCVLTLWPALAKVAADSAWEGEYPAVRAGQQVVVKLFGAGVGTLDSYGSGILISDDGHVLTVWNHLVNTGFLTAVVPDGRRFRANVVGTNQEHDVAVLKLVADDDETFEFVNWKATTDVLPAESVLAFSNMFHVATGNEPVSVVHGVVACIVPLDAGLGRWTFPVKEPVYVLDAITNNSGAAGGLLTSASGAPIGMLGREIRHRDTDMWVNYAVPLKDLRPAIAAILEGRRFDSNASTDDKKSVLSDRQLTAGFGITLLPSIVETTPAYIDRIITGSVADTAGLRRGDLVLMVGDDVVRSTNDLRARLSGFRRGQPITVTVNRNDKLETMLLRAP
ncbi:MAG: S1C family serine protease [Fuerstiella sp.]